MTINIKALSKYIAAEHNVLILGPAGTGKTQSLIEATKLADMKMKYFSASTLDPYIDLVGLPVAEDGENGKELKMLRNKALDDVEVVFFDEINRAELKTLNALFEMIQFKSINGEPLPNLKTVVAAMNPVGDGYEGTQELDVALMDRFEVYLETKNVADPKYFTNVFGKEMGEVLVTWHRNHDHNESGYLSPRRLEKIGRAWGLFPGRTTLKDMMPPAGEYNVNGLYRQLVELNKDPDSIAVDGTLPERIDVMSDNDVLAAREEIYEIIDTLDEHEAATVRSAVARSIASKLTPEETAENWLGLYEKMTAQEKLMLANNWKRDDFAKFIKLRQTV